jgi:hypothetical protein
LDNVSSKVKETILLDNKSTVTTVLESVDSIDKKMFGKMIILKVHDKQLNKIVLHIDPAKVTYSYDELMRLDVGTLIEMTNFKVSTDAEVIFCEDLRATTSKIAKNNYDDITEVIAKRNSKVYLDGEEIEAKSGDEDISMDKNDQELVKSTFNSLLPKHFKTSLEVREKLNTEWTNEATEGTTSTSSSNVGTSGEPTNKKAKVEIEKKLTRFVEIKDVTKANTAKVRTIGQVVGIERDIQRVNDPEGEYSISVDLLAKGECEISRTKPFNSITVQYFSPSKDDLIFAILQNSYNMIIDVDGVYPVIMDRNFATNNNPLKLRGNNRFGTKVEVIDPDPPQLYEHPFKDPASLGRTIMYGCSLKFSYSSGSFNFKTFNNLKGRTYQILTGDIHGRLTLFGENIEKFPLKNGNRYALTFARHIFVEKCNFYCYNLSTYSHISLIGPI